MELHDHLTVRGMLHRAARWYANNEAAVDEVSRLTYRELETAVRQCAGLYHDLGVRKGDRVALLTYSSTVHCIALFGAIELGAIPVVLHVRETEAVLAECLRRFSPRVLVYDGALDEKVGALLRHNQFVTGVVRAQSPAQRGGDPSFAVNARIPEELHRYGLTGEPMPVSEDDPVVIVLSSGTTGIPKGVIHTNRSLMASTRGGIYVWNGIKSTDSVTNTLSTGFIAWYLTTLPFMNAGGKVICRHRWNPREFLEAVLSERITHLHLIPTMWRLFFQEVGEGLGSQNLDFVKGVMFGGELMDQATLDRIRREICPNVVNVYGSTECGSFSGGVCIFGEEITPERMNATGKPTLNGDIRVIRPGGGVADELPPGETGEVIMRGPSVASAIWDAPEVTRRVFRDGWWHSGDVGRIASDGYLYLDGRHDDMIVSGGINIMPTVVEQALLSHPGVAECAVVGLPDPVWGQRVTACVVPRSGNLSDAELHAFVRSGSLADFQRPKAIKIVSDLPRTSSGKINRRLLRESLGDRE